MLVVITMDVSVCWGQTLRKAEDYYGRGLARQEKGDLEGAIADFDKAIEILPKYAAAYGSRGRNPKLGARATAASKATQGRRITLGPRG